MKNLVLVLLALAVAVSPAFAQMSREEKLRKIDHEIAWYQGQKKTGMLMTLAGLGVGLLSYAFYPTTECSYDYYDSGCEEKGSYGAFGAMLLGGTILASWGGYKWSDAGYNIRQLELKKFDLSFHPLYMPKQGNALGIAMAGTF